jgi:hypothetical protein
MAGRGSEEMTSDDPRDRRRLRALHEVDAEAVLGTPVPKEWICASCKHQHSGTPAAYLKRGEKLEFLCFECLLKQGFGAR